MSQHVTTNLVIQANLMCNNLSVIKSYQIHLVSRFLCIWQRVGRTYFVAMFQASKVTSGNDQVTLELLMISVLTRRLE